MSRFGVNRELAACDSCGHPRLAHFGGGCYCGCAGATALPPAARRASSARDLPSVLRARVSDVTREQRDAWDLVKEAARLRAEGQPDEALDVARRAKAVATAPAEQTAAVTLVVASLCDLWRDEEARREGEAALQSDVSPHLLRALGRAWFLGFVATGVEEFRTWAHERFRAADELEAVAV